MDGVSPRVSVINIEHIARTNQIEKTPETNTIERNKEETTDHLKTTILWKCFQSIKKYFQKYQGLHEKRPDRLLWSEYFWSFFGCLISNILVALLHYHILEKRQLVFLTAAFAASTILVFCNFRSPVSQPRNLIGGHLVGAIIGCIMRISLARVETSTACGLAMGITVIVMQYTETLHPPGGATAVLAVISQPTLPWAHFLFIFIPTLTSACILLILAVIINNIPSNRTYPCFWW